MPKIETTPELVKNTYEAMKAKLAVVRERSRVEAHDVDPDPEVGGVAEQ